MCSRYIKVFSQCALFKKMQLLFSSADKRTACMPNRHNVDMRRSREMNAVMTSLSYFFPVFDSCFV